MNTRLKYILIFILFVAISLGIFHLKFSDSYDVFFEKKDIQYTAYKDLEDDYGINETLLIYLETKDSDIFTPNTWKLINQVAKSLEEIGTPFNVQSLVSVKNPLRDGDTLYLNTFIEDSRNPNQNELDNAKSIIINNPLYVHKLINEKGNGTSIIAKYNKSLTQKTSGHKAGKEVLQLLDKLRIEYPDHQFSVTGSLMMQWAFVEIEMQDIIFLIPSLMIILLLFLYHTFRSWWAVGICFINMLIPLCIAMGVAGWLNFNITAISIFAPIIIMSLALCDCVHILYNFFQNLHELKDRDRAITKSLSFNHQSVFLTSLSTALGFLTLNFSGSDAFSALGNITCIGVIVAYIVTISLTGKMVKLHTWKKTPPSLFQNNLRFFSLLNSFIANHYRKILIVSAIITCICFYSLSSLSFNDSLLSWFSKGNSFRKDTEKVIQNLGGIFPIEFTLKASKGVHDPEFIQNYLNLNSWVKTQNEVSHTNAISDKLRLTHQMIGDKEKKFEDIFDKELLAQYLFFLTSFSDSTSELGLNFLQDEALLTVYLKNIDAKGLIRFIEESELWIQGHIPDSMQGNITGPSVMFTHLAKNNINQMIQAFIAMLILVSILFYWATKSTITVIYSFIVNIWPLVIALGIWGLYSENIGMAVAIIFPIALGIIIDDTFHFLGKFSKVSQNTSLLTNTIQITYSKAGIPIIQTSLLIIISSAVLLISSFQLNYLLGFFLLLCISSALLGDLVILPALLHLKKR